MTLQVGIIGTGFGIDVHLPSFSYHPDFEVRAIAGRSFKKTNQLADVHGLEPYKSWQELVAEPNLDVISVVTPNTLHYEIGKAVLTSNKHLLMEKPVTTKALEARDLYNLALSNELIGMVAHEFRWIPEIAYMHDLIVNENVLGDLRDIFLHRYYNYSPTPEKPFFDWHWDTKYDGGELSLGGSHFIDIIRFLTNREFSELQGRLYTRIKKRKTSAGVYENVRVDDAFTIEFEMEGGLSGNYSTTNTLNPAPKSRIVIGGDKGSCYYEADKLYFGKSDNGFDELKIPEKYKLVEYMKDKDWHIPPFITLLNNLAESINDGVNRAPSLYDGWKIQQVIDGVRKSHHIGSRIKLSDYS